MREGIKQCHVCTRTYRQVQIRAHMGCTHDFNTSWINHNEMRTLAQTALQSRPKHWMRFCRVGTHNHNDVRFGHRSEVLCPRRLT